MKLRLEVRLFLSTDKLQLRGNLEIRIVHVIMNNHLLFMLVRNLV